MLSAPFAASLIIPLARLPNIFHFQIAVLLLSFSIRSMLDGIGIFVAITLRLSIKINTLVLVSWNSGQPMSYKE